MGRSEDGEMGKVGVRNLHTLVVLGRSTVELKGSVP